MRVMERIAEFLGFLSDRIVELVLEQRLSRQENAAMATTLSTLIDKLTEQGRQIDSLVAQRDAQEQADLNKLDGLLDANGAKITAALGPTPSASPNPPVPQVTDAPVPDAAGLVGVVQTTG